MCLTLIYSLQIFDFYYIVEKILQTLFLRQMNIDNASNMNEFDTVFSYLFHYMDTSDIFVLP